MPFRKTTVRRRVNAAGGMNSFQFYSLLTGEIAIIQPTENERWPFRDDAHERECWEKYHADVMRVFHHGWPEAWGEACLDLTSDVWRRYRSTCWALDKYGMPPAKPAKAKRPKATPAPTAPSPVNGQESTLAGPLPP